MTLFFSHYFFRWTETAQAQKNAEKNQNNNITTSSYQNDNNSGREGGREKEREREREKSRERILKKIGESEHILESFISPRFKPIRSLVNISVIFSYSNYRF